MSDRAVVYLTADVIVKCDDEILLIQRKNEPFKDRWALPGGFVDKDERALRAAQRELKEETGIEYPQGWFKLVGVYDEPGRDPRGRMVSYVYLLEALSKPEATALDDAKDVKWFKLNDLPLLAFDHYFMIEDCKSIDL